MYTLGEEGKWSSILQRERIYEEVIYMPLVYRRCKGEVEECIKEGKSIRR